MSLAPSGAEAAGPAPALQSVGVIGAGQMGNGIAHVAAQSGLSAIMIDVNPEALDKARATIDRGVLDAVEQAEQELGETGRVLLRPSGTEPVVRVMVEAPTDEQATEVAERLAAIVSERVGL